MLCNNIRRLRFEHNDMSQEELANAVGVTRQTIISIEKGKYTPSVLLALKIAKFFGRIVEEVIYLKEGENNGESSG